MIKYLETNNNLELPEIQGYKRQFSINIPQGEEKQESKEPQIVYIQQPREEQTKEVVKETPVQNEWSDIHSIIKNNEGFMSTAKALFNEPSASIGYGFFDKLPDGTKITPGMRISKTQADRQLNIALDKLSSSVQGSLDKYGLQTSPEQFNVLLDLGYHGGTGLVDKLLKESNGNSAKVGSLLLRYATTAKYGDKSIEGALKNRALRRSQGWNKYTLKGKNGLKLPKFQNPADTIPKVTDSLTNGSKTFTEMCAEFQNKVLRNSGYKTANNAWNLENADLYMSGYDTLEKPTKYNLYKIQKYNRDAANNLRQNLDPNMLDPNSIYIANMYYTGSPFQEQAYKEGRDNITGTHTGYVKFNPDSNKWEVTHNIHGTVYVDSLDNVLGSRGKYGVTALLKPQKQTFKDKAVDTLKLIGQKIYNNGSIQAKKSGGVLKYQNSGKLHFWSRLAKQLQSAPSNGETTIATHNADLNRQVEQARKEAKSKNENPDRAEEEVYKKGLLGTLGGMAAGQAGVTSMAASIGTFGPVVADITNGVFAVDATKNLASENGIKKTADLYKSGKTGKAIGNTALNLLDLSFIGHTGALLGRLGKTAYTTGKGLKNAYASDLVSRELSKSIQELKYIPGKVKYYGPTMGKTTAAKSNSNLVDFDDIVRKPSKDILNKYGFSSKYEMFESGNKEAIKEYQDMLVSEMKKFKADPKNSGKTLIVSPAPVVNPEKTGFKFDNTPSIPSKEEFVRRNIQRGGTKRESENWWSNLIKENPNLKIDDRYISEIEQSIPNNHQLFRATVYKGGNIKDPQSVFFTTDPEYAKQYGVLNKYLLEQKGPVAIAKEPMIGSRDVVAQDMFIDRNAANGQNIIVGHDAITSDIPRQSKGIEILSIGKPNVLQQLTNTQNTFDANWKIPSKLSPISEKELNGIVKQERNSPIRNLNRVVGRDGTINEKELLKTYHKILKENPISIRANEQYTSGNEISSLKQHLTGVVKTAQTIPVPKGSSRAELVRAALIHDIGKLITGQESLGGDVLHPLVGKNIIATTLKDTEFNTPAIRAATRYHMYQNGRLGTFNRHGVIYEKDPLTGSMKINYDLIRALQTADVSRGLPYDKAAAKFPQLFTYAKENPVKVKFAHGDVDWELKNVVNPILKKEGYGTIKPKENIAEQLNANRERHRSMLRGNRDPLKTGEEGILEEDAIRNAKNASENAIRFYGEDTPLNRMLVSAQRVSSAPTGYGRADLFTIKKDTNGLSIYKPNWLAEYLKIDPKTQDAIYVSGSSDILNTYSNVNGSRSARGLKTRVTLPFEKLKEQEHLPDFMERTDFQLYDGAAIHSGKSPMSNWQKYELPYRLQTGRSMKKDMLDEYTYFFGEPEFGGSKKIAGSKLVDPESFDGKTLLNWKNNKGSLADLFDKNGVKFDPVKQIDGKIMVNRKGSNLMSTYNNILMCAENKPFEFIYTYGDRLIEDGILTDKQVTTLKHITTKLRKKRAENTDWTDYAWHPGMTELPEDPYTSEMKKQLEKYIFNKNFAYRFKDLFYKTVKPTYKFQSDASYVKYINDEENWINFMRRHGVSPVWEMPNFGKTSLISTNGGRWGEGPATRNKPIVGSANPQGIVIGNLNEKLFDVTKMDMNKVKIELKKYRDKGQRYLSEDVWPITRKTFKFGGILNKKPNSE